MGERRKQSRKPPEPVVTGRCEVCGERAFYGYSNRGWNRREFCATHRADGEAYLKELADER